MKKILFLILFLTGLFPVFDSNGLYLGNYRSYGQGELNEIELVDCTGVSSSIAYETDQYIEYEDCAEEYNYDYQFCEPTLDCVYRTEYKDGSDPCDPDTYDEALCNESNCSTICPSGMVLNNACECVAPPCTITCPEGQRVTLDCGCEEIPPPSNCRVACLPGYTEINCVCVQNPPPPVPDDCTPASKVAGVTATNLFNNNAVSTTMSQMPILFPSNKPPYSQQVEHGFNIKNINGVISTTPIRSGTATSLPSADYTLNVIADLHDHPSPGAVAPSAKDLFALDTKRDVMSGFTTSYVRSSDGNIYALYINDANKLNAFVNNNPGFVDPITNDFKVGTPVGDMFWDTNFDLQRQGYTPREAYTRATTLVLQDAGVSLLKSNATTIDFKKIDIKVVGDDPNGNTIIIINDCK